MKASSIDRPWSLRQKWMPSFETGFWQEKLANDLNWQQPVVCIYGAKHVVPRKTVFLADNGISYRYSGHTHCGIGWPGWFLPLLFDVNKACGVIFNGCLLNLYRNGEDCMGWHADNEPELDMTQPIASLSLGADRDLRLKHRYKLDKELVHLDNGDLFIMEPICQKYWLHCLPVRKRCFGQRINLTFRRYIIDK